MIATSTATALAVDLHRTSNKWVSNLALLAITVGTWLSATVAGGTWMFYERADKTLGLDDVGPGLDAEGLMPQVYLTLAFIACAFVIPPIIGLISQSAVLGAAGRERRLAILRLIGLSSADITRITVLETLYQTVLGLVLGTALSVAAAPAWSFVSFNDDRLGTWEMLLPWWGYPLLWVVVVILSVYSAVNGLMRVAISPLGVSRREIPASVKWWRFAVFAGLGAAFYVYFTRQGLNDLVAGGVGVTGFMFLVFFSIHLVAPWILQTVVRLLRPVPGRAVFIATRRIVADPKQAWRRVMAMAFVSLLFGYVVLMPLTPVNDSFDAQFFADVITGVVITFGIGLLLVLVSTLLTQASVVYEEAELTRALAHMGVPPSLHRRVAWLQTLIPLLIMAVSAFLFGVLIFTAMFIGEADVTPQRIEVFVGGYAAATLAVAGITLAVDPLRRELLGLRVRRND
ncbi:FtsX-like permease family protein [Corynebacterium uterequi]|uniref:FtsX-like permease family n=1 Tax=Corynebacterium uterequi TaxID=1072256 RepID=A0A0G3HEH4_9CORY|nr:FtsX-like permease family protein [Corynebacterium uterequi]AKK10373.1 FtsX-like permease family [Corynebacterium uterequi]